MTHNADATLTRSQRRAARLARQKQVEQYHRKDRQHNVLAESGPLCSALVLDHPRASFNIPKIFRSMRAFGDAEVHLVNIGVFDTASAKGSKN